MDWEELKNDKERLLDAIDDFGVRGLARKVGVSHPTIIKYRDIALENFSTSNSETKEATEEIKPKAEDYGDYYIITSGKRSFEINKEDYKAIRRDYSGKNYLTINQICRKHQLPRWKFSLLKNAFGFTHDDTPFTDEEVLNNNPEELAEMELQRRKDQYFNKLQEKEVNDAFKELRKYQREEYLLEKLMDSTESYFKGFADEYTPLKLNNQEPIESKLMFELPIVDLHYSKLSWEGETGENYDRKIAEERFLRVISDFIKRTADKDFEKILFPVGNDYFNFDNPDGETARGTRQDNDSRWQKMYNKGNELLIKGIDILAQKAPVDVFVVPGNHDTMTSYHAVHFLNAWYRNIDRVEVSINPKTRKYRRFGSNLIGFAHLDQEKSRIFGCMQNEAKKDWGNTKYHEWHGAHVHSEQVDEKLGLIVRNISSITAKDAWHYKKGYQSLAKAQAFIWHKKKGLVDIMMHNIE